MRNVVLIIALFLSQTIMACVDGTCITTQSQFDKAVSRINKGEEMHLVLGKGRYVLNESLVAKAPISIKGKDAVITCASNPFTIQDKERETSTHYVYRLSQPLSLFPLFYDENDKIIPVSESVIDSIGVNYVEGDIVAPKEFDAGVTIKIPISSNLEHLKNKVFQKAFGYLDSGWGVVNFMLERSDSQYLYCTTINRCSTKDFQYDRRVYKKKVRFVIYNAEQKLDRVFYDDEKIYVPKNVKDLYCVNRVDKEHKIPVILTYSDVELEGVCFVGMSEITVKSPLLAKCDINKCYFKNSISTILRIEKENGQGVKPAIISGCRFMDCALQTGNIVYLSSEHVGDVCIKMEKCTVSRYPDGVVGYKNPSGSVYVTANADIEDNIIYNTCRDHLFLWKGEITVSGNVLFNSDVFNSYPERNFSSDWGIVYCGYIYTDTEEALKNRENHITIENNLLYGAYAYGNNARGVFIDDGRGDVLCKKNIILNTQRYTIDSRYSRLCDASSVRNRYEGNILSSNYHLASGPAVTGEALPTTQGNIVLTETPNVISNSVIESDDVFLNVDSWCSCDGKTILVSKGLFKLLRQSQAWKKIGKSVKKGRNK